MKPMSLKGKMIACCAVHCLLLGKSMYILKPCIKKFITNQSKNKNTMYNFKISEEGKKQRKLNQLPKKREKKEITFKKCKH